MTPFFETNWEDEKYDEFFNLSYFAHDEDKIRKLERAKKRIESLKNAGLTPWTHDEVINLYIKGGNLYPNGSTTAARVQGVEMLLKSFFYMDINDEIMNADSISFSKITKDIKKGNYWGKYKKNVDPDKWGFRDPEIPKLLRERGYGENIMH